LLCVLLGPITLASALEYQAELPVAAYHLGGQTNCLGKPYNDTQFKSAGISLGLREDFDTRYAGVKAGTYENSWFIRSNYLVGDFGGRFGRFNLGAEAGIISGYRTRLAAAPYVEVLLTKDLSANLAYLQTTVARGHSAIGLTAGYHF